MQWLHQLNSYPFPVCIFQYALAPNTRILFTSQISSCVYKCHLCLFQECWKSRWTLWTWRTVCPSFVITPVLSWPPRQTRYWLCCRRPARPPVQILSYLGLINISTMCVHFMHLQISHHFQNPSASLVGNVVMSFKQKSLIHVINKITMYSIFTISLFVGTVTIRTLLLSLYTGIDHTQYFTPLKQKSFQ